MSCIFYRFKSQKTDSRLPIDGTGISVFDLKKEIILANHMGEGKDFDLGLYDASAEEEYKDDTFMIPRSTSVIARRLPPARPGKGTAAIYVAGTDDGSSRSSQQQQKNTGPLRGGMAGGGGGRGGFAGGGGPHMQRRFDGKDDGGSKSMPAIIAGPSVGGDDEAAKIAAMFQAEANQWQETQEDMAHHTPIYSARGGRGGGRGGGFVGSGHKSSMESFEPDKPLPPGYICYRCGQRGHWIQACPTNEDKDFDNRPRFKRTTGIPRSFLKVVEAPAGTEGAAGGVMITPEGGFVVAEPDSAAWEKQRLAKPKVVTEAEIREEPPSDPSLACGICSTLLSQAVRTPCCDARFCEECIQAHLLENDFKCPRCAKNVGSLDRLEVDRGAREKVGEYIKAEIERRRDEDDETVKEETKKIPTGPSNPGPTAPSATAGNGSPAPPGSDANNKQHQHQQQQFQEQLPDPIFLQRQLAQMMMMLQNPNLSPQNRMQINLNVQTLNQQLQMIAIQQQSVQQFPFNQHNPHIQQHQMPYGQQQHPSMNGGGGGASGVPNGSERLLANGRRRGLKRGPAGSAGGESANKSAKS